jgi:hypothetical protein
MRMATTTFGEDSGEVPEPRMDSNGDGIVETPEEGRREVLKYADRNAHWRANWPKVTVE